MRELGIDIETYSSRSLSECGVYKYAEAPDFAILLFAYSVDNGPAACVDLAQGEEPAGRDPGGAHRPGRDQDSLERGV